MQDILPVIGAVVAFTSLGIIVLYFLRGRSSPDLRTLMSASTSQAAQKASQARQSIRKPHSAESQEQYEKDIGRLKAQAKKRFKAKAQFTLEEKLFQAGIYTPEDKREFQRLRLLAPIFTCPLLGIPMWMFTGPQLGLMGIVLGLLAGLQLPFTILDRKIQHRTEEILYFLPLVIEQIAIGVSSSLDIGPCLQRIVSLADERDTHNVVTELIRYALIYIKSGVSFEDAMTETGKATGQTELKHAFMFLSQVAKHGGEISRQLQELADSVSRQREAHIEERINKLELSATFPLTMVFAGFLIILLIGLGSQFSRVFE